MVDVNAALGHHLFQIAQAEIVGKIPAGSIKIRPLNMTNSRIHRKLCSQATAFSSAARM
ncbi:hypothetical protein X764_32705 [Mesorhizobium sp. LSHC440A00]|nr:hypothetical protein X764_32705 [Mesorhizobium sp. LSHC440A00]